MHHFWPDDQPQPLHAVAAAPTTGKRAVMRIFDPIDSDGAPWGVSAKDFAAALDALPSGTDTIELHINSPGGHATDGIAILNSLRQHPAKVEVVVDGLAASAASYVAMAGDTVSMAPSATMMIHDPSAMAFGQATTMRMAADMLDTLGESMADIYAGRAGGSAEDWRLAMQPGTWYSAQEAVDAGLADRVLPDGAAATDPPKARFDLSVYADARREPFIPAARAAHKTPAEPPEKHPTTEEAVTMTETEIKALRERLGLAEDADTSAINAKLDELEEAATKPREEEDVDKLAAALAKANGVDAEQVNAALDAAKNGKVSVSQSYLDALSEKAEAGVKALERQDREDRDATLAAAQTAGKIGRDEKTVASWQRDWERDPEATKAELDKLPARFPVSKPSGYAGSDASDGDGTKPFTDDEAAALAQLGGVSKEALLHG